MNTVRTMPSPRQPGDAGAGDRWARWLVEARHGGDPAALEATLNLLAPIRDRVLAGATLSGSETLLDLGCGDGLIGFAACRPGLPEWCPWPRGRDRMSW